MSDDGDSYRGPPRTAPYPLSRLSAPVQLVRVAEEIETADALLRSVAGAKLEAIAQQIRALQEQAAGVLEQTRRDAELHRAHCQLHKRPGCVYHLYRRANGEQYLSLLSPEDWKGAPPHEHQGGFRLEPDMGWTPVDAIAERDGERAALDELLRPR